MPKAESAASEEALPVLTPGEVKFRSFFTDYIAKKEVNLGFPLDDSDKAEFETIQRNKYCGKSGLYSNIEGGGCTEAKIVGSQYCGKDGIYSALPGDGCNQPRKQRAPPADSGLGTQSPSLASLPTPGDLLKAAYGQ